MALKPPQGSTAQKDTDALHRVYAQVDLTEIGARLESETLRLYAEGSRTGLRGQELADFVDAGLHDLSDTDIEEAARGASSQANNLGRNLGAQSSAVGTATRSALFDENTCPPCRALDGTVVQKNGPVVSATQEAIAMMGELGIDPNSPGAYFDLMPPAGCDGLDLCRDFYLYEP